jgi:hypothetical protein
MIDGHGDPNTAPAYAAAVQALYSVAYTIRFGLERRPDPVGAPVMPLEGLWWTPDMATVSTDDTSAWDWTLLIAVPELVTADVVDDARAAASRKHPGAPLDEVRMERFAEGRCAQVLHVGPLPRRGADGGGAARLHRRERARAHREAPRDLPRPPPAQPAREAADDRAAAGRLIAGPLPLIGAERTLWPRCPIPAGSCR